MEVEYRREKNLLVVRLKEELDLHAVARVRELVQTELNRTGACTLLLNLSGVSFMDSSGLGFILGRYRYLQEKGGRILLATPISQVRRVLELGGVNRIIPIYDTEEEAYQAGEEV